MADVSWPTCSEIQGYESVVRQQPPVRTVEALLLIISSPLELRVLMVAPGITVGFARC